jgi:hypothetical protein
MSKAKSTIDSVVEANRRSKLVKAEPAPEPLANPFKGFGRGWADKEGRKHRLNGPAIEWNSGKKEWWVHGQRYTEDEFFNYVDPITKKLTVPFGQEYLLKPDPDG